MLPLLIGLVVTRSPSLKALDPEMKPVTDPSEFFFHRLTVGTPFGADLAGATFLGTGGALFGAGAARLGAGLGAGAGAGLSSPAPSPKRENVDRGLAFLRDSSAAFFSFSCRSRVKVMVAPGCAPAKSLIAEKKPDWFTAASGLRKYRLPDFVATTAPFSTLPLVMGDVSTKSPSEKLGEL